MTRRRNITGSNVGVHLECLAATDQTRWSGGLTGASRRSKFGRVKFAKIYFEDDQVAAKALVGMALRGRVIGLRDHVFIVPEPALGWLAENALPYQLITWMNESGRCRSDATK